MMRHEPVWLSDRFVEHHRGDGHERDKGADDWNETAENHRFSTVLLEEGVCARQIVPIQQPPQPAAIRGGATGASFAAASLSAGRPIRGDPGGSGAAAGAAAGAGAGDAAGARAAGCCAAAPSVNALRKAPASKARRAVE